MDRDRMADYQAMVTELRITASEAGLFGQPEEFRQSAEICG